MKINIYIFILILFALPFISFGQNKSVTKQEYYSVLNEAESKTEQQIRKRVKVQKLFSGKKVTKTITDTTEHLPPNYSKWISIEEKDGKVVKRIEQITINNAVYRKTDDGEWIKREKSSGGGFGIGGTDNSTREYFIDEAVIGKEKYRVLIEKTVNYNKTFFDEDKIWINKNGLIFKQISTTSNNDLQNIVSTVEVIFDYKIKAPAITVPVK